MIQQQQTFFLELYGAGMRAASELTRASLENTQRMQSLALEQMQRNADAWSSLWRTASESQAAMISQMGQMQGQVQGASAANADRSKERKSA